MSRQLYCFNAVGMRETGVVIDYDKTLYASPFDQVVAERPDCVCFTELNFVPVWVKDIYEPWFQWQCLHGEQCFNLSPFQMSLPFKSLVFTLDVQKLAEMYNPFVLSKWIWGSHVTRNAVEMAVKAKHYEPKVKHGVHGVGGLYHCQRIAYLVKHRDDTPIHLYGAGMWGVPFIVENGNHRLAAALVRGDETIRATMSGDVKKIAPYLTYEKDAVTLLGMYLTAR